MLTYYDNSPTYKVTDMALEANDSKPVLGNTLGHVPTSCLDTTADCVKIIEYVVGKGKWKRVAKKDFRTWGSCPIRSFEDKNSGKVVSIYYEDPDYGDGKGYAYVLDFDLRIAQPEIDQINAFCKHYVCPDGGTVYYDPMLKRVLLSISDSFCIYTADPKNKAQVKIDAIDFYEHNKDWMPDPAKHIDTQLSFLTEAIFMDEDVPEGSHGFIEIGSYKTFSDLGVQY